MMKGFCFLIMLTLQLSAIMGILVLLSKPRALNKVHTQLTKAI